MTDTRPTIIYVVHERIGAVGGIQRFDLRAIRALAEIAHERKWQLDVIAFNGISSGVDLPPETRLHSADGQPRRLLPLLQRLCMRRDVRQLYLGHLRLAKILWPVLAMQPRVRKLLFVHGVEAWQRGRSEIRRFASRTIVNHCIDDLISVSQFSLDRIRDAMQVKTPRTHVLPNAIDVDDMPERSHRPGDSRTKPVVISVTRMDSHDMEKGIPAALRAIARLTSQFPQLQYHIIGDGVLRGRLEELARELEIEQHVTFLGRVSDAQLNASYRAADVFLLPSSKEGFGIVFLEAWRAGLPVVCGNVDASKEVVEDGVDGFTVPPTDPNAIAEAVATLLHDPELGQRFVNNGRRKLLGIYSSASFLDNLRAIAGSAAPEAAASTRDAAE